MIKYFLFLLTSISIQAPILAWPFTCAQYFEKLGYKNNREVDVDNSFEVLYNIRNNFNDEIKLWKICKTDTPGNLFAFRGGKVFCNEKLFASLSNQDNEVFGSFYDKNGNEWGVGSNLNEYYWPGNQYWLDLNGCYYDPEKSLYFEKRIHNISAYVPYANQYFRIIGKEKRYFKIGIRPNFDNTESNSFPPVRKNIELPIETQDSDYLYKLLKKRKKLCNAGGYWKKNECFYYEQLRKKMSKMGLKLPPY